MDWPSVLLEGDMLIVREDAAQGRVRFVVRSVDVPPVAFPTYAEAEAHAISRAEQTGSHAWYRDGRRLHLVERGGADPRV
jgi:hypothetical protein